MTYVDGFVTAVPAANKDAYRRHAEDAAAMLKECGVARMVETWGDDVPDGQVTDFKGAVKAEADEVVVLSWFEYPSRAARDAAGQKMMSDPRMDAIMTNAPFDGKRMIYGGFEVLFDQGAGEAGYVDGSLLPFPLAEREAVEAHLGRFSAVIAEHGAGRMVRAYGDDIRDGKVTDFKRAVKAQDGEGVVFMWIEWPSKAVRDQAWGKVMADPRMFEGGPPPFDGKRQVNGGFVPILDL